MRAQHEIKLQKNKASILFWGKQLYTVWVQYIRQNDFVPNTAVWQMEKVPLSDFSFYFPFVKKINK